MEFLEDNLGRKDNKIVNANPNPELTPSAIRKSSDAMKDELNTNLKNLLADKRGFLIIGICGGQSSGKSSISQYLQKNLPNTAIISEKDFFIGSKERRKSTVEEKMNILNMTDDEYSVARKHRLVDINSYKNFDWDGLSNVLCQFKNKEIVHIPTWDKEKQLQVSSSQTLNPAVNKYLILEGQFIFFNEVIRNLLDYRLFVETDDDIRLARMVLKENIYINDKPSAMKSFFTIYEDYIKPCYIKFIEPTKKYAHLILPNFAFNSSLEIVETTVLDFMVLNLHSITTK